MKHLLSLLFVVVFCFVAATISWNFSPNVQQGFNGMLHNQYAQEASTQPDSVVGDPDISSTFIDGVLSGAGSPAAGLGEAMYQDGQAFHIKPSFALSIFHMESNYGLAGVAPINHSIGNIRSSTGGYRSYASWGAGVKDFYQLIKTQYVDKGLTTVVQILPVYAPASDGNNPNHYIAVVRQDMSAWQKQAQVQR